MKEKTDRLGDLSDLPPALRAQLSGQKRAPTLIDHVRTALEGLEGVATTDELLVAVYRLTGRVCNRRSFEVQLYNAVASKRIGIRRLRPGGRDIRRLGVIGKACTLQPR